MINTRLEKLIHDFATRILPTVYDDSMTYLELVYKMKHYLNLTVDQVNALTEAFNLVLTNTLPDNVEAVLDGWYASGKLDTIINAGLLNTVNANFKDSITLHPVAGDNTPQIQSAIDSMPNGGTIHFTQGDYLLNMYGLDLKSNIKLMARGAVRLLADQYVMSVNKNQGGTPDPETNIKNIHIEGITFEHITKAFAEFYHLLNLNACTNVEVTKCKFVGFRGDAICLASGNVGTQERHNKNVYIHDNIFDGVANQNRNAITVGDCDGIRIENNIFMNTTKSGMPGAIDFEPNPQTYHVIKNVSIKGNIFKNIGGDSCLTFNIPSVVAFDPKNIVIEGNTFDTVNVRSIHISLDKPLVYGGDPMGIIIRGNNLNVGKLWVKNVRDVTIENNITNGLMVIGSENNALVRCEDIKILKNTFKTAGDGWTPIQYSNVKKLSIEDNIFTPPKTGALCFILAYGAGGVTTMSSYVKIKGNRFEKGGTASVTHILLASSHTFDGITNIYEGNITDVILVNMFPYNIKPDKVGSGTFNSSTLPDNFPLGTSIDLVYSGDEGLPDTYKQGVLETVKPAVESNRRVFIVQRYFPANNTATQAVQLYFRRATSANGWTVWKLLTAV